MPSDTLTTIRPYPLGTNLELHSDSIDLVYLPLKGSYVRLYRGERVVVAETDIHSGDTIDIHWVKLAASQEGQGWLRESEMKEAFVPVDSVSQAIHLFSHTHIPGFLVICALFVAVWIQRLVRRKQLKVVWFNDINSLYPASLTLLMAICATLYETMQVFRPDVWERFYYNPTLSPLDAELLPAIFLSTLWLFFIVLLAALEVVFRRLGPSEALFYLLGLATACIFCYYFFVLTVPLYIGYLFLLLFFAYYSYKMFVLLHSVHYTCGACGGDLQGKGRCPHCGAINE